MAYDQQLADAETEIARLNAELVKVAAERDDAVSALRAFGLIVRGAVAPLISAADVLAPQQVPELAGVSRLFRDLHAAPATDGGMQRAPVIRMPMRTDTRTEQQAPADAPAGAQTPPTTGRTGS